MVRGRRSTDLRKTDHFELKQLEGRVSFKLAVLGPSHFSRPVGFQMSVIKKIF